MRIEQEKKIGVQEEKIRQLENEIVILKEDNLRSDLNFSQTEVITRRTIFDRPLLSGHIRPTMIDKAIFLGTVICESYVGYSIVI